MKKERSDEYFRGSLHRRAPPPPTPSPGPAAPEIQGFRRFAPPYSCNTCGVPSIPGGLPRLYNHDDDDEVPPYIYTTFFCTAFRGTAILI